MYRTILVPSDGSEYAEEAARQAIALATEHGAALHVLSVVDRRVHDEPGLSSEELVTIEAEDLYHDCVSELRDRAATVGIDVECAVRHGIPHEAIAEYAEEIDADVILVGAHGDHHTHLGGIGRKVRRATDREVRVVDPGVSPDPSLVEPGR